MFQLPKHFYITFVIVTGAFHIHVFSCRLQNESFTEQILKQFFHK